MASKRYRTFMLILYEDDVNYFDYINQITQKQFKNNNYRYLHFSSSMFYLCGDELVNWSGGCFPEQLIVYDPLTNKIKTDYKNIKTTIFKINI